MFWNTRRSKRKVQWKLSRAVATKLEDHQYSHWEIPKILDKRIMNLWQQKENLVKNDKQLCRLNGLEMSH